MKEHSGIPLIFLHLPQNFTTGCVTPISIDNSLTRMLKKGCTMASAFLHEELNISEEGKTQKRFYDLLKSKAKTMSELKKSVKIHKNMSLSGEVMYLRLMSVKALKNINSKNFLLKIFPCYLICLPFNMHKIIFYTETCGTLDWG